MRLLSWRVHVLELGAVALVLLRGDQLALGGDLDRVHPAHLAEHPSNWRWSRSISSRTMRGPGAAPARSPFSTARNRSSS